MNISTRNYSRESKTKYLREAEMSVAFFVRGGFLFKFVFAFTEGK